MKQTEEDVVMNTDDLARFLSVDKGTLYRWRKNGTLPFGRKLSTKKIVWMRSAIIDWINSGGGVD